jgi:hypothetical protein
MSMQAAWDAQAEEAGEEAEQTRLERRRYLGGWSANGVWVYGVKLVTGKDELEEAARELSGGEPTAYVVLRVAQGGSGDVNAAASLRQLVDHGGYIARPPSAGELEALNRGLDEMGIQHAGLLPGPLSVAVPSSRRGQPPHRRGPAPWCAP